MKYFYSRACGLEVGDHYVVTGGVNHGTTLGRARQRRTPPVAVDDALHVVAKYSQTGFVEYLPALNQGRYDHACSSYISDSGETVGFIL